MVEITSGVWKTLWSINKRGVFIRNLRVHAMISTKEFQLWGERHVTKKKIHDFFFDLSLSKKWNIAKQNKNSTKWHEKNVTSSIASSHARFVRHILFVIFLLKIRTIIAWINWTEFQTELSPNTMQYNFKNHVDTADDIKRRFNQLRPNC